MSIMLTQVKEKIIYAFQTAAKFVSSLSSRISQIFSISMSHLFSHKNQPSPLYGRITAKPQVSIDKDQNTSSNIPKTTSNKKSKTITCSIKEQACIDAFKNRFSSKKLQ